MAPESLAKAKERHRWLSVIALAFAIAVAGYVGFRLPNCWSVTLDAVSLTDGFHRRFVVGTLLRPLAIATDYNYWLFATFSYAVLASLLAILTVNALRTTCLVKRLMIIAFFLLPTGPFLFHEVGYFEQVLYLLLFIAIWLMRRQRHVAAVAVMCVSPFVHEIAILTTIPVFGAIALRTVSIRRATIMTLIPAALDGIVLAIPPAHADAARTLAAALQSSNFAYRQDALDLFYRSQADNWSLYRVHDIVVQVKPVTMFVVAAFGALWLAAGGLWAGKGTDRALVGIASATAIATPALLVYAGWDHNRWIFLVLANFFVVVWFSIDKLRATAICMLATTLLVFGHIRLDFFPPDSPRVVAYRPVRAFLNHIVDGTLFRKPDY